MSPNVCLARVDFRHVSTLAVALWVGTGCGDDSTQIPAPPEPPQSGFRKVTIDDDPGEPIGLAVLPSGDILHTTRDGRVWLHAAAGGKTLAAALPVYTHDEEGLQGIAIDPDFEQNGWVYVYYSPPESTPSDDPATPDVDEGEALPEGSPEDWAPFRGEMRLSRFVFDGTELDRSSEQIILRVPTDRGICCHLGGQIDFDAAGDLYLSTGDDTNPFESDGYTPIDERPGRHPAFDAQRSAANTNDLRGKLLRIRVAADGTYGIPEGNLFPPGTPGTRAEIYAMGLRNPFRFAVDRRSGDIYLGDYAPDAASSSEQRGPAGTGRWMRVTAPVNYGWPYCVAPGRPYIDFDFASAVSRSAFDCAAPRNESPNNTGLTDLPPATSGDIHYTYRGSEAHPLLGPGGIGPMGGPAYVYDAANPSPGKWPEEYDGVPLFYEWTRDEVLAVRLNPDRSVAALDALPWSFTVDNPIDVEFGPDGALYVLEYGDGYHRANPEAQLARIEYVPPP